MRSFTVRAALKMFESQRMYDAFIAFSDLMKNLSYNELYEKTREVIQHLKLREWKTLFQQNTVLMPISLICTFQFLV